MNFTFPKVWLEGNMFAELIPYINNITYKKLIRNNNIDFICSASANQA
jgi:hypothetical protein